MPGLFVPVIVTAAPGSPIGLIAASVLNIKGETGAETLKGAAKRTTAKIASELKIIFKRNGWI